MPSKDAPDRRDLMAVQDNVQAALTALPDTLEFVTSKPKSSSAPGVFRQAYLDGSGLYLCVGLNTWIKLAGSSF
jgi:hypothetical protein